MSEIHSDAEFETFMERIDARLRAQRVPFASRSLAGLSLVCQELRISLPGWTEKRPPRPGIYSGMDLAIRIADWFNDRYGDRAAWDPRPGRTVVLLRDDPWEIVLPRFFGSFRLFASATEPSDPVGPVAQPNDVLPRYNVVESVTHLGAGLKRVLSREELNAVSEVFRTALDAYHLMERIAGAPLLREAMGDIDISVAEMLNAPGRYGASKWASLQAAEKAIKAYLTSLGERPKKHHELVRLASSAYEHGLGPIPERLLSTAQATAAVRYREVHVNLTEAAAAHYAALDICAHVASYMATNAPEALVHNSASV